MHFGTKQKQTNKNHLSPALFEKAGWYTHVVWLRKQDGIHM